MLGGDGLRERWPALGEPVRGRAESDAVGGLHHPRKETSLSPAGRRGPRSNCWKARNCSGEGYDLFGTRGSGGILNDHGCNAPRSGRTKSKNLMCWITCAKRNRSRYQHSKGPLARGLENDYLIRRAAVDYNIPLITNARGRRVHKRVLPPEDR